MAKQKLNPGSNREHIWNQLNRKTPLNSKAVIQALKDNQIEMDYTYVSSVISQLVKAGWARSKRMGTGVYFLQSHPSETWAGKGADTKQPALRIRILQHLRTHIGVGVTKAEIIKATNSSNKTSVISTQLTAFEKLNLIKTNQVGKLKHYTALPAITNYAFNTPSKSADQAISETLPPPTHLPIQTPIQTPALQDLPSIPADIVNAGPLDLGSMVNQLVAVNQQNQMYRQAFEAIMHIMEQIGIAESN